VKAGRKLVAIFGLWLVAACPASAAPWKATSLPMPAGELFLLNVSCPTASFCVATGTQNLIASSTNPSDGAGAWNVVYAGEGRYVSPLGATVISNRQVQGVSCPSPHLCVAVTNLGQIYASTDPTGPASAWSVAEMSDEGRNTHLYGVSCPTESLCVVVSGRRVNSGKIFTSTNPTGGTGAWQETDLGEALDLRAVSCSSPTFCVAAGYGGELIASRHPTGGASAWFVVGSPGGPGVLQSIACPPGICLTGNSGGNLLTSTEPAQLGGWRETSTGAAVQITGASCASPVACLAVDSNGDVIASTNPTDPRPDWSLAHLRPYSEGAEEPGSADANGLFGASCPTTSFCAVVGSRGSIFTSDEPFAAPPPSNPAPPAGSAKPRHGPKRPHARIARLHFRAHRRDTKRAKMLVRFYAKGPLKSYECQLDRDGFHRCRSPKRYSGIGQGVHKIAVRAVGLTGLRGPVAVRNFFVGKYCATNYCLEGAGEIPASGR
jgi:hypothetical protein